jgi:ectoine hydroxylase-related dioxygenase (phytanoyl-CoA dioxygenase family)
MPEPYVVTAWIALLPSTVENGSMKVVDIRRSEPDGRG